jgi:DNA invertase Pin-like site-specific DNA recombinase
MRIGYARVSTGDQNPDLQEDALQKAGCQKIFRDVASGAADCRKGLAEAIEYARDGDTLVVVEGMRDLRTRVKRGKMSVRQMVKEGRRF